MLKLATKTFLVTLIGLTLLGCSTGQPLSVYKEPENISFNLQAARDLYATIRQMVVARVQVAQRLCAEDKLSPSQCKQIEKDLAAMQALDFEVMRKLNQPTAEFDFDKALHLLEIAGKLISVVL